MKNTFIVYNYFHLRLFIFMDTANQNVILETGSMSKKLVFMIIGYVC